MLSSASLLSFGVGEMLDLTDAFRYGLHSEKKNLLRSSCKSFEPPSFHVIYYISIRLQHRFSLTSPDSVALFDSSARVLSPRSISRTLAPSQRWRRIHQLFFFFAFVPSAALILLRPMPPPTQMEDLLRRPSRGIERVGGGRVEKERRRRRTRSRRSSNTTHRLPMRRSSIYRSTGAEQASTELHGCSDPPPPAQRRPVDLQKEKERQ